MVSQHCPATGQGHSGERPDTWPFQAGHCSNPAQWEEAGVQRLVVGRRLGEQLSCHPFSYRGKGGSQRGKMALLPWSPPTMPSASDYRLEEEWAGLVRTCLQPAFLPSRLGKLLSWFCFLFLKPDQRWDPTGSPSKIAALWSLGVSAGKPGAGGGTVPGPRCRQGSGARYSQDWSCR